MPRPTKGETEQDFVSRYVSDPEAMRKYPQVDQRLAIAYSLSKKRRKKRRGRIGKELWPYARKLFDGEVSALDAAPGKITTNKSTMSARAVFATTTRDRVGDVLEVSGILCESHRGSPVVTWNHAITFPLPIGKTIDRAGNYTVTCDAELGEATQETFFSQSLPMAAQIFGLIDEGIVNANSIGYRELKSSRLPPSDVMLNTVRRRDAPTGKHIESCELLEIAWTIVGANGECVREIVDRDTIDGKRLAPCIKSMLMPLARPKKVWSPGATLENTAMAKAMTPQSATDETTGGALRNKKRDPMVEDTDPASESLHEQSDKETAGETQPDAEGEITEVDEGQVEPLGVKSLREYHHDLGRMHHHYSKDMHLQEHEPYKVLMGDHLERYKGMAQEVRDHFGKHHTDFPELDMKGWDEENEQAAEHDETEPERAAGADETAEVANEQQPGDDLETEDRPTKKDFHQQMAGLGTLAMKVMQTKGMNNMEREAVEEAKDFMEEMSGHNGEVSKSQRAACKYHSSRLKDIVGRYSKPNEQQEAPEERTVSNDVGSSQMGIKKASTDEDADLTYEEKKMLAEAESAWDRRAVKLANIVDERHGRLGA
jgi:hypothetical protein